MTDVLLWIWLQKKLGYASKYAQDVINHPGGARFFYECSESELKAAGIFSGKVIKNIISDRNLDEAESVYIRCMALGHSIITPESEFYPKALKQIENPPLVIYAVGNLTAINNELSIAVVGTRRARTYNLYVAQEIGFRLAKAGVTVISGCAVGIDSAAHTGAIAANGITVGVLGCGIDYSYNQTGEKLREAIKVKGALISEYPPGSEPKSENFPLRNRIISGLSLGVTVVQASKRSGALITARLALEQGRDLFAYYAENNLATLASIHKLGESNVALVTSPEEILRPYASRFGNSINTEGIEYPFRSRPDLMPQNIQKAVDELAGIAVSRRIHQTDGQAEFAPTADLSAERTYLPFPKFAVTEVIDYSKWNEMNSAEVAADETKDLITNGNIADKNYHSRDVQPSENRKITPSIEQIVSSAEKIGLTPEQIDALIVQIEKMHQSRYLEAADENGAENTGVSISAVDPLPPDISDEARIIYEKLKENSDTIDNIALLAGMTVSMAAEFILELELYGLIHSLPGGRYAVSEFFFQ